MVIFLLSFVKGSKSAEGGKNPLADMDPGGPNPLGHRQARNFTTKVSKILDLKSFSEQIFSEN